MTCELSSWEIPCTSEYFWVICFGIHSIHLHSGYPMPFEIGTDSPQCKKTSYKPNAEVGFWRTYPSMVHQELFPGITAPGSSSWSIAHGGLEQLWHGSSLDQLIFCVAKIYQALWCVAASKSHKETQVMLKIGIYLLYLSGKIHEVWRKHEVRSSARLC